VIDTEVGGVVLPEIHPLLLPEISDLEVVLRPHVRRFEVLLLVVGEKGSI
jgi:hypothetical protein